MTWSADSQIIWTNKKPAAATMLLTASRVVELVRYRELIKNLVIRDIKTRYKNSILGFLWCLANPLLMMLVFTIVFTILMRGNTIPNFPVFILVGILAWNLHLTGTMGALNSIVNHSGLVTKVYFPREILPISAVLSNTVNFLFALIILFVMILIFKIHLSLSLILLPFILLTQVIFITGLGLFLSSINVYFRDTGIVMETLMLAWFFLTPIFYRIEDLFPTYSRIMYWANPMASLIAAYRDVLYSGGMPDLYFLTRTFITAIVVFVIGYLVFLRLNRNFAEAL